MPYDAALRYSIYGEPGEKGHSCVTVDVSTSGLGIICDMPLEFGSFLEFEREGGSHPALNGVVQWSMPAGEKFRAGLFLF